MDLNKMKPSGIQLIAEFSGCSPTILNNEDELELILLDGIKRCGLFSLKIVSHKFDPVGVTLISILKESHVALHTFPEDQLASIDIFHCSTNTDSHFKLMAFLQKKLHARTAKFVEIERGERLSLKTTNCDNDSLSFRSKIPSHKDFN
jgi:S-adenosylmethionine decarboxylase proenzyme